jgi:hypothetical protein
MAGAFDRYVAIYKLACHWEIDAAKDYAKAGIDSIVSAGKDHAVKMLQFSHQHHVDDWFAASFRQLVERNITTYNDPELEKIGLRTFLLIAKTQASIRRHRLHVARFPPPITHSVCCPEDERGTCAVAYEDLWWKTVGRPLLDPKYGIPTMLILGIISKVVVTNMNLKCWEKTKLNIVSHKYDECLNGEDWIMDTVVCKLKEGENMDTISEINTMTSA